MTKQEFSYFASALRNYYVKEQILPNEQAMELWYRQLCDIPYMIAEKALMAWVDTNEWSPSIADIRKACAKIQVGDIPDWGEAWESVLWAIKRYGAYEPGLAMASFDDITRQTVKRLGFIELCRSENIAADRANFRDIYNQIANRKITDAQIPASLRISIEKVKMLLEKKDSEEGRGIDESEELSFTD